MTRIINKLEYFFRQDFCKPCDFFVFDKQTIKKELKKNPLKLIPAFIILIILNSLFMILYYLTLPFRVINELVELYCEW